MPEVKSEKPAPKTVDKQETTGLYSVSASTVNPTKNQGQSLDPVSRRNQSQKLHARNLQWVDEKIRLAQEKGWKLAWKTLSGQSVTLFQTLNS